ncbi:YueI family protein [Neobacillus mesonae]|uniref:YueI family protein n=1 Tax=Neobacillus mesonae TaxID=1193713 RepID=UPI00203DC15B|nr:YueI family protein [Neobacillus mesonae]MCM3570185.1 YueI family protein [Neobacillus mesonae]
MKKTSVEEVLQQGIHGALETKPDERRKYLGTLRERIVVALKKAQVAEDTIYPQVEQYMKEYPKAHLFLNGDLNYDQLSKYIKKAAKYKIKHTIVTNKESNTNIGLVLAMDYAIEKNEIFISMKAPEIQQASKKGFFAKLFGKGV